VLCRPAPPRARPIVIGPDDLVEKALPPEDLIEQKLAVVGLAIVDVEVQRPLALQQPMGLFQARCEERKIIVEGVAVGRFLEQPRLVAAALKASSVATLVGHRLQRLAGLRLPCVERRVYVDQLEGLIRESRQQLEVFAEQYLVEDWLASALGHRCPRLDSNQRPAD
jgi:hypothetical protein